jgi:hypothetical protein
VVTILTHTGKFFVSLDYNFNDRTINFKTLDFLSNIEIGLKFFQSPKLACLMFFYRDTYEALCVCQSNKKKEG